MTYKVTETYTLSLSREEVEMLTYSLETTIKESLKVGDHSFTTILADLKDAFYNMIYHE